MHAVVDQFDFARGDGFVTDEQGRRFYFHCVTISDGTRSIDVGAPVTARESVGHLGRDEVCEVEKLN